MENNGCLSVLWVMLILVMLLNTCNRVDSLERKIDRLEDKIR